MKPIPKSSLAVFAVALVLSGCKGVKPPRGVTPMDRTIVLTAYCSCGKCCNWKRTWYGRPVIATGPRKGKKKVIGLTASGTKAKVGTIAADTSLYPFGTIVYVPGYGYGRVEDRGGAIKGQRMDLFFESHDDALQWGRQTKRVRIWIQP
ncbi:MAG: 3D domain-containing protein [Chloroflexi bacterium]|nr:3D domain-containing protein [Chloroflexota bacterium]